MPRFQSRVDADTPYTDGQTFLTCYPQNVVGASGVRARNAFGQVYTTIPASSSCFVNIDLGEIDYRFGVQDDLQEQFGGGTTTLVGAQGLSIPPGVATTPAGVSGRPPYPGVTEFIPVTTARPKGIKVTSITAVFQVIGANATTNTLALSKTTFANNVAPAISTILPAQSLALVVQAQPYVTNFVVANPPWLTAQNSQYLIDWNVVTPVGSSLNVYGVMLYYTYNFN